MSTSSSGRLHEALDALADLDAALDSLAEARLWSMSSNEVRDLAVGLERIGRRVAHAQLVALGQADSIGVAAENASPSTASWLRIVADVPIGVGRARLQLHHDLGNRRIAGAALAAGSISVEAAAAVCTAMNELPAEVPAALLADVEDLLVDTARDEGTRAAMHRAADIAHRFNPDALAEREERQRQKRFLSLAHQHDGTLLLRGRFDSEAGALISSILGPLAAPAPASDGVPDLRDGNTRYADALVRLCEIASGCPDMSNVRGERPALTVTVGLETLRRELNQPPGCFDTGFAMSAETARRLACDARVIPVVLGSNSEPVDVGRASYVVPQPMRRALIARDGGCAFPGCERPAAWCDAHHIIPWADGGETALSNLVLLCGYHHTAIHGEGWNVHLGHDHKPWFTPPPWIDSRQMPRQHSKYKTRTLRQ